MRIGQVPNSQLSALDAGTAQRLPALTPGQRLLVTVLANDDGLLQLLADGGTDVTRTIAARTELPLIPGQQLPVIVTGGDNGQIVLRLANGPGELAPLTPEAIAQSLALPTGEAWQAVLTSLIRDSLPLTRDLAERVMTIWRRSGLPKPEPAALLWLTERGISPLPERVALAKAFRAAHQGRGEPPGDALMAAVDVPGDDGPLQFSIWMAGIDVPTANPDGHGRQQAGLGGDGTTAGGDEPCDGSGQAARPAVVLLSVTTANLGAVEALIEVTGESVAVTCFSDDSEAVRALTAEINQLRGALDAAGLVPGTLAVRAPAAIAAETPSLRRVDLKI